MGKIIQPSLTNLILSSEKVSNEINKLVPAYKKILSRKFIPVTEDFDLDLVPRNPGIYYFEANFRPFNYGDNFYDAFSLLWDETSVGINVSAINKKRVRDYICRIESDEWIPLYLGKRQDLRLRLEQHIFSPTNNSTYALRLVNRKLIDHIDFRVNFIPINLPDKHYFCMDRIETKLRKSMLPIVGKQ